MRIKIISNIIMLSLVSFVSCKNNEYSSQKGPSFSNKEIPVFDMFNQLEEKYFILVYSPSCLACKSTLEVVEYVANNKYIDIYLIKFAEINNRENNSNIGKNNYLDVSIKSVPYLCKIEEKVLIEEYIGFENIRDYITKI